MKMKVQNFIILLIIDALKNNVHGKGMRLVYDITIDRGHEESTIEFKRKDGQHDNPRDFFFLGLYIDWDQK